MAFLPGLTNFITHVGKVTLPPVVVKQLKKANTISEGIVLPHGLQSVAARQTRMGKTHSTHTGMMIVNGVLTYFSFGLYSAILAAAMQLAKEERARRLKDKMQKWDISTNLQLDAADAEALRLDTERARIAAGGDVNPDFILSANTGEKVG
jgi:hypothetical protein